VNPRKRILAELADEYLEHARDPIVTELGRFASYIIATRRKQFAKDNDLEWADLREALSGKVPYTDNYLNGLIIR